MNSMHGYKYYLYNIFQIFNHKYFKGWGRKKTGKFASWCYQKFGGSLILKEDGFIRSMDLGIKGSPSFSLVEDKKGIYYDATGESDLENILNSYDFNADEALIQKAEDAMDLIKKYHISKYNNAANISDDFFKDKGKKRILIIAQTAGDASLEYGLGNKFTTKQMIDEAMNENLNASVYLKIHPDVLVGKKESDIKREEIPKECIILDEDMNPISLLKNFSKVYTKTSGMGMEAIILGLEVVCYGLPYYAGWGLTIDKQTCIRRTQKLSIEELFAGAYILYTRYYNPYRKRPSDIIDVINEIVLQKKKAKHEKIQRAQSQWR
ncbi:MAG: Capsular polysaccharide export system protein KpsC [uncultured Sulfurovum sp.]|uniref:Capsular polysaccharide export system protein KpsC n=1 Tax=uncultured Sulfurovum sp. TaxID=269237 RepID=A0A6S6U171_9BACT|nr:MAG: Capsular polysaccharide export system protein KpsC [uncultured Sulfurovum sp.]